MHFVSGVYTDYIGNYISNNACSRAINDLIKAHSCDVQWIMKMMSSTAALINDGEQDCLL